MVHKETAVVIFDRYGLYSVKKIENNSLYLPEFIGATQTLAQPVVQHLASPPQS